MKRFSRLNRRAFLAGGASVALTGCDRITETKTAQDMLAGAEAASYRAQRALIGADKLAPEFTAADISKFFKPNGSIDPKDAAYRKAAKANFVDWKLEVGGLVEKPRAYSLAELRALPARTQITRHDCVEGWSSIAKWKGALLAPILEDVQLKSQARYVVFHCADSLGDDEVQGDPGDDADDGPQGMQLGGSLDGTKPTYYETIDLLDARHPQTILAYEMNDVVLPVLHGAPLRLRLERQLGYKMAKYIMRLELVDTFAGLGDGKGGYWEDRGYDWYAGV